MTLEEALAAAPIVAILRGVRASEIVEIGDALLQAGIRAIEVPLNSPDPLRTIALLVEHAGERAVCGAGTVRFGAEVDAVIDACARIVVAPNTSRDVIERTLKRGAIPVPGFFTPTEAVEATSAGARYLKLFPASVGGPTHLRAVRTILDADVRILAVGAIRGPDMPAWRAAGAAGFGVGSDLYTPGQSAEMTYERARALAGAARQDNAGGPLAGEAAANSENSP
jgi:2-dehydro-3-deoxyphosphogalactonate aldolase